MSDVLNSKTTYRYKHYLDSPFSSVKNECPAFEPLLSASPLHYIYLRTWSLYTVMITNAMRAAQPRLTRRRIRPARRPSGQALRRRRRRAKCQFQIRLSPTDLNLTTRGWLA